MWQYWVGFVIYDDDNFNNLNDEINNNEIVEIIEIVLGKGDLFGSDLCLDEKIPISKSSCDVKSLTYCDLQCINLEGFKSVLRLYPEYAEHCANDLLNDLTYNLREGFVDPDDKDAIFAPAITLPTISEETGSAASEIQAMTVGASETNSISSVACATNNSVTQSANGDGAVQETSVSGKNSKQSSTENEEGADDNGADAAKKLNEKKDVPRRLKLLMVLFHFYFFTFFISSSQVHETTNSSLTK